MNIKFNDHLVLVTGAAQGIGRATAECFKAARARLHLLDIDEAGVATTASKIGENYSAVDLGDHKEVATCMLHIRANQHPRTRSWWRAWASWAIDIEGIRTGLARRLRR
jgi:3-oxoacyl-[acyl-carrier protein] reductase